MTATEDRAMFDFMKTLPYENFRNEVTDSLAAIFEGIEMSIHFTADQRDKFLSAVSQKFKIVDETFDAAIERVENIENLLLMSIIALAQKAGFPLDNESKKGLADMLHINWEESISDYRDYKANRISESG